VILALIQGNISGFYPINTDRRNFAS